MLLFEETFFNGYKIGSHLTNLKMLLKLNDIKIIKEIYPNITEELIKDFSNVDITNLKECEIFYKLYEPIFESSTITEDIKLSATTATKEYIRKQKLNAIMNDLKNFQTFKTNSDNTLKVLTIKTNNTKRKIFDLTLTENRIKLAETFSLMQDISTKEILIELENNSKKQIFRFRNLILDIVSEDDYIIYAIEYVDKNKPWKIEKNYNYSEKVVQFDIDKYNLILDKI